MTLKDSSKNHIALILLMETKLIYIICVCCHADMKERTNDK